MSEKSAIMRARRAKREGQASTQAGEFVREEMASRTVWSSANSW